MTKFILQKASDGSTYPCYNMKEEMDEEAKQYYKSLGAKIETVYEYDRRTLTKEEMAKKFPKLNWSGYVNDGKGGCWRKFKIQALVINLKDVLKFVNTVEEDVIVRYTGDYELPVLEIYDDYVE